MAFANRDQLKTQLDKCRRFTAVESIHAVNPGVIKDLIVASQDGKLSDVQSVLSRLVDLGEEENEMSIVDFAIHAAACLACSWERVDVLHYLLQHKKSIVTEFDEYAYFLLFAAALDRPNPDIWTLLIDQVGCGMPSKPGILSDSYAAAKADSLILQRKPHAHNVLRLFIDRGFRPQFDHVEKAATEGSPECLLVVLSDILPRHPAGHFHNQYVLQNTAMKNKLENAKILIEKGVVDINDVPTWRQSPEWFGDLPRPAPALQWALSNLDMIRMLMQHGARINVPNSIGITPIEWARKYKRYEAEKLMLELAPPEDIPESYKEMLGRAEN